MKQEDIRVLWTEPEWLDEVHVWIEERIAEQGFLCTGEIVQPHVRPWATALNIPTDRGVLWFKAITPTLEHESAITAALCRWMPGRTPSVLAHDADRNWLLMADGGVTLRSLVRQGGDGLLTMAAARYAEFQRDVACRTEAMLALKTPDCRLAGLATLYERLISDTNALYIGESDGLSEPEYVQLQELAPRVSDAAAELAAFGVPETIQHDDLHSNNILIKDGLPIVFDWGDCSVGHPLLSLTVLLRGAARDLNVETNSPAVLAIRKAYLEAWDLPLSDSDMERACLLADMLGRISRALTYARLLPGLDMVHRHEYEKCVPGWLQEFLDTAALPS